MCVCVCVCVLFIKYSKHYTPTVLSNVKRFRCSNSNHNQLWHGVYGNMSGIAGFCWKIISPFSLKNFISLTKMKNGEKWKSKCERRKWSVCMSVNEKQNDKSRIVVRACEGMKTERTIKGLRALLFIHCKKFCFGFVSIEVNALDIYA